VVDVEPAVVFPFPAVGAIEGLPFPSQFNKSLCARVTKSIFPNVAERVGPTPLLLLLVVPSVPGMVWDGGGMGPNTALLLAVVFFALLPFSVLESRPLSPPPLRCCCWAKFLQCAAHSGGR